MRLHLRAQRADCAVQARRVGSSPASGDGAAVGALVRPTALRASARGALAAHAPGCRDSPPLVRLLAARCGAPASPPADGLLGADHAVRNASPAKTLRVYAQGGPWLPMVCLPCGVEPPRPAPPCSRLVAARCLHAVAVLCRDHVAGCIEHQTRHGLLVQLVHVWDAWSLCGAQRVLSDSGAPGGGGCCSADSVRAP